MLWCELRHNQHTRQVKLNDHRDLDPKYLGTQSGYSAEQKDIILRDITLGVCIGNVAHSSIVELVNIIAKSPVLCPRNTQTLRHGYFLPLCLAQMLLVYPYFLPNDTIPIDLSSQQLNMAVQHYQSTPAAMSPTLRQVAVEVQKQQLCEPALNHTTSPEAQADSQLNRKGSCPVMSGVQLHKEYSSTPTAEDQAVRDEDQFSRTASRAAIKAQLRGGMGCEGMFTWCYLLCCSWYCFRRRT